MPLYAYCCENKRCEKHTKILQYIVPLKKFDEPIPCPKCGKPLRRELSAPYFTVK